MKDPVVQSGDPVLRKVAKALPKKEFGSPTLKKLLQKMKKSLAQEPFGVALAAPQVGESLRLFIIAGKVFMAPRDEDDEEDGRQVPPDKVFINPEILRLSKGKKEMSEGCLSVRGRYGTVMRHEKASVRAFDENGKEFIYNGSGLVAHIFQHEMDHLEGVLYTDKAKKLSSDEERVELREKFPA